MIAHHVIAQYENPLVQAAKNGTLPEGEYWYCPNPPDYSQIYDVSKLERSMAAEIMKDFP